MKFGVFLPTFLTDEGPRREAIRSFARVAERIGYDSIWVTDHLIRANRFYRVAWLEPMTVLSYVAAVTERVRLGTGILIMPLRHPVLLAKEIASLQELSGGRFILGGGTGWCDQEFEAIGRSKAHRGTLTDEIFELVDRLLSQPSVTYEGRHFQLRDVSIEPRGPRPPFWVAGGSQVPREESPERPTLHPRVLARIVRSDGWVTRPTALPEQIGADWAIIRSALAAAGVDRDRFVVAHENFCHVVETDDEEVALNRQREAYARVMSDARPFEYFRDVYLTGTPQDIVDRLVARARAGVRYFMLHPLTSDPEQLEAWWDLIVVPVQRATEGH